MDTDSVCKKIKPNGLCFLIPKLPVPSDRCHLRNEGLVCCVNVTVSIVLAG
jgi:hypothetical protein